MIIIGLTGKIASGKTFVSSVFKAKDFICFNSDEIVSNFYCNNQKVINSIRNIYPDLYQKGVISKENIIHAIEYNCSILDSIEEIIFPELFGYLQRFISNIKNNRILIEVPMIYKSNIYTLCHKIIVMEVSEQTQLYRINKSRTYSRQYTKIIVDRNNTNLFYGDYYISSDTTKQKLIDKVNTQINEILATYE